MNCGYDIKAVLEIIFKVAKKNADILAHEYLMKDKSIISKWRNNKAIPRNDDISKIVEFTVNESTLSQKNIIRNNIEALIKREPIKEDLKNIILNTLDFEEFLQEAISVAVSMSEYDTEPKKVEKRKTPESNSFAGHIKNTNRSYRGTIEFDLEMPQESGEKYINILNGSGMELQGKINIATKNPIAKAVENLKKAQALGIVFLIGISMVVFAASYTNTHSKEMKVLSNKNSNDLSTVESSAYVPVAEARDQTPAPTSTPLPTPTPENKPSSVSLPKSSAAPVNNQNSDQKEAQNNIKQKINNTETNTTVNNNSNTTTIINNGDNAVIVQGNQISVGFDKN